MRFGVIKGTILGLSRILRCVGFLFEGGQDDIPETFSREYMKAQRLAFRRHKKSKTLL